MNDSSKDKEQSADLTVFVGVLCILGAALAVCFILGTALADPPPKIAKSSLNTYEQAGAGPVYRK